MSVSLEQGLSTVADAAPLINAVTNKVTVNDVAQIIRNWGGLPVMGDDEREVAAMVAGADACLINMGWVSETGESTMLAAGRAANEHGKPVVLDPVGVGATPTRNRVATRLASELDVAIVKGNYGEVTALVGDDASVRGVESVGEYDEIAATAMACAREYDTVVVASGVPDVVATPQAASEITAGDPMMATVVGTGCMLGATLATVIGPIEDAERAALLGTVAFGMAGELAASEAFGAVDGPASYNVALHDATAGLRNRDLGDPDGRIERVLAAED